MKPLATEVFLFDGRKIKLNWYQGFPDPKINVSQVSAYCVYNGKLVIVKNKRGWGIPGGHPKTGETIKETLERELDEETEIRKWYKAIIIGWMEIEDPNNEGVEGKKSAQIRYLILLSKLPKFIPDNEIFERKLINIDDFPKYVQWANKPTGKAQIETLKLNLK